MFEMPLLAEACNLFEGRTSNKTAETNSLKGAKLNTLFESFCQLNFNLNFNFPYFLSYPAGEFARIESQSLFVRILQCPFR